jgi:hypothetical protein
LVGAFTVGGLVNWHDPTADENTLLGAAIGTTGGAVLGLVTANDVSPTIGRVRFIDLGGLVGSLVGTGLYLSAANRNSSESGLFWSANLGTCAGLATAWLATSGMAHDYGDDTGAPQQAQRSSWGLSRAVDSARPMLMPARGGVQLG